MFLSKNMTSRLQPLNAGITRNFKHKYRKLLLRFVLSWIDNGQTASQIVEDVHAFKEIMWLQTAWKNVIPETIKDCFKTCGFDLENNSDANEEINIEFRELFK